MNTYEIWLEKATDKEILSELLAIKEDKQGIDDRFYRALEFGTGGLRGVLGAGTNRMNVYTVGRATFGLADYLLEKFEKPSVVIAYDSRRMSKEFASLAAEILSAKGIKAYLFSELMPTPVLSFAVRRLKATAGIVITASHNPKEYNGYKVYNQYGCQITDLAAKEILANIERNGYFNEYTPENDLIELLDDEVLNAYLSEIEKYRLSNVDGTDMPKIVYTPLHGTGNKPVREILRRMGCKNVFVVKEQEFPDGDFTTCPYPNPEEKETLRLAVEFAKKENAGLVLATDPDADRVGIAVRDENGAFQLLNGNETGVLLMNYMLSQKKAQGSLGENATVIKTVVTTDMAFGIAEKYGANVQEVLTGFKYIGEAMDETDNFVHGLEESYGFLVGTHARDKDAVSAVMLIVEMYAYYDSQGKTLLQVLDELFREFGYYVTDLQSKTYPGADGKKTMDRIMERIRLTRSVGYNDEKMQFTDFSLGINGLPKSNVLRFADQETRIILRPSGTEPKLKIYYQVKGETKEKALQSLHEIKKAVADKTL